MKISGWGRYPIVDAKERTFRSLNELKGIIVNEPHCIARGLGRSYGDSSLADVVISTRYFNKFLAFDDSSGVLTCQAGVSIAEILATFIPRGWFIPVSPGTKFVTIGGAIASDIHGKNHHVAGSFSQHIEWLEVMLANGELKRCSPDSNSELFWSTCGGMGLTGIVTAAAIRLLPIESSLIRQEQIKARNLQEIMELFEESAEWTYTVAWLNCMASGKNVGRSVMLRGEHARAEELSATPYARNPLAVAKGGKLNVPFALPEFVLNKLSMRLFNFAYYHKSLQKVTRSLVSYEPFFYPLDGVHNWNRIYGNRGFTQYQLVLPKESSAQGLRAILNAIAASKEGSFLTVLKLFGKQSNLLSFPTEGYTLSLDFPITRTLFGFLDRLDEIVVDYGGRLYLTKDARMSPAMFRKTYAHLDDFINHKQLFDQSNKFSSVQSQRLGL